MYASTKNSGIIYTYKVSGLILKIISIDYSWNLDQGITTCDQSPGTHLKGHGCLLHFCRVLGFLRVFDFIVDFLNPLRFFLRSRLS